MAETMGKI